MKPGSNICIYVRSIAYAQDIRRGIHQTHQYISGPMEMTYVAEKSLDSRLFDTGSARVLHTVQSLAEPIRERVQVIDVAFITGRLKAWRAGVRHFPAMVVAGAQYCGADEVCKALAELI